MLAIAASLEKLSEHPLAQAIVSRAEADKLALEEARDFDAVAGKGVRGSIDGKPAWMGNAQLMQDAAIDVSRPLQRWSHYRHRVRLSCTSRSAASSPVTLASPTR